MNDWNDNEQNNESLSEPVGSISMDEYVKWYGEQALQIRQFREQISTLISENQGLASQIPGLMSQAAEAKKIPSLQGEIERLKAAADKLGPLNEELQKRNAQIQELTAQITNLSQGAAREDAQNQIREKNENKLQAKQVALDEVNAIVASLQQKLEEQTLMSEELKKENAKLKKNNAAPVEKLKKQSVPAKKKGVSK